jgi:hypothetical protein
MVEESFSLGKPKTAEEVIAYYRRAFRLRVQRLEKLVQVENPPENLLIRELLAVVTAAQIGYGGTMASFLEAKWLTNALIENGICTICGGRPIANIGANACQQCFEERIKEERISMLMEQDPIGPVS